MNLKRLIFGAWRDTTNAYLAGMGKPPLLLEGICYECGEPNSDGFRLCESCRIELRVEYPPERKLLDQDKE